MAHRRGPAGRVVAVTGAGNGIGRRIAVHLAAAGAHVAVGDLDVEAARAVAAELDASQPSGRVVALPLDVTDEASFTAFLDATEQALGPIDVLVNNAGVMWVGPYDEEPASAAARMAAVNLLGPIRGVRLAAPRMTARGGGHIVTIASVASKFAPAGEATYAATKHGIYGYLKAVRLELRGTNVQLSAVMPGVVDTALAAGTGTGPVPLLSPDRVARAVLGVIARPRFEVVVPGHLELLHRLYVLAPQVIRDLAGRLALPDQVAAVRTRAGAAARQQYEATTFEP